MTVIYEAKENNPKRYRVEFWGSGKWVVSSSTFRTRLFAKSHADGFANLGHRARVIDTKGEES